ncbi:alginate export family protein [Dyella choica]|uniref:Alginate export family protein n=1 Tax=Dyella choica TaxID=1927959 RepID=A0A432MA19_9GAMM|nr:alginate export family protein [Dyella choica]RUL78997.1 alginate export family protein [Dyella choica]
MPLALACAAGWPLSTWADDAANQTSPARPAIDFFRWQEDWSVLADPRVPRMPGDALKYLAFSKHDPKRYLSLGVTLRERVVSVDPPLFGAAGGGHQNYLLHRLQVHADAHLTDNTRLFVQLENALAPWLDHPKSVDANRLDLRLAFVDTQRKLGDGLFKLRIGRQEMGFDLQRFISVRDGPNVRQAYDAIWADYERGAWRISGFVSQPVQYRNLSAFDDFSNRHLLFGGVRVQRRLTAGSEVSVSFSDFRQDRVHFLAASGNEERQSWDVHYKGNAQALDWDVEGVKQGGSIDAKNVDAWAFGSLAGWTFKQWGWTPRIGMQLDAASGNHNLTGRVVETFNPLFPNGYYVTMSGYTGYTNFVHFKPSLALVPRDGVKLTASFGMLWRQTLQDAIYVQPDIPVPGTAGKPGRRSSIYAELQVNWNAARNLAFSLEADRYFVAPVLRRAGGKDSNYLGVEMRWGW